MNTYKLSNGVNLHIINTKKYKDVSLFINFYNNVSKDRICRALLTNIIGNKSVKYNSKKAITNKKDMLYGTSFSLNNITKAEAHIFQIHSKILNEKFTLEDTNNELFDFIYEIIENPIIDEDTLNESKEILINKSLRKIDNPTSYSLSRLFEIYGKDNFIQNLTILKKEEIEAISLDDLKSAYNSMITNDSIDIYIAGDVIDENIINKFKTYNIFLNNKKDKIKNQIDINPNYNDYYLEEEKNITQSCLIMTYKTNVDYNLDEYYALRVANTYLGAVPGSLLFQQVREKNSLCYSINSSVFKEEGLLIIKTLINSDNSEKTITLIKEQINKLKQNDFNFNEVKECLNLYTNIINGVSDDISQTINMLYVSNIDNKEFDLEYDIKKMNEVTKDDIVNVINKLDLKIVYLLKEVK